MCVRFKQRGRVVVPGKQAWVRTLDGERRLQFGYDAPWRIAGADLLTNARLETLTHRAAWREAATHRRCAVEVDAWYVREVQVKTEMGERVWLAGLWWEKGFLLLTRASGPDLVTLHDRQPAFVQRPELWITMHVDAAKRTLQAEPPYPLARPLVRPGSGRGRPALNEGLAAFA